MFRLNFVEFACIVACGVAMVELSAGHRFVLQPVTVSASALAASGAGAAAGSSRADVNPRSQAGRR